MGKILLVSKSKCQTLEVWWQLALHSVTSTVLALMAEFHHSEVDISALVHQLLCAWYRYTVSPLQHHSITPHLVPAHTSVLR